MNKIIKSFFQKTIINSVFLLINEVKGEYNLPKNGGYIVASNHASHIDPFTIGSIIFKKRGKIVNYLGKKESLDNIFGRFIYSIFDVIPIKRSSKSKKPIYRALKVLKKNGIVGIFPEGTRTYDGRINKGKTGIARLIMLSNAPVLPVAIKNTYELWPRHNKLPKIKRVIRVNIGKPTSFANNHGKTVSKRLLRSITESIMERIAKLYLDMK
ncbi:MAG: lysophospholipid acyltransferase family protein [Nanoarchaeota archaeon]|nr:lysophospholipid acyltransferase family protein [Nanoarchaeota archaeon]